MSDEEDSGVAGLRDDVEVVIPVEDRLRLTSAAEYPRIGPTCGEVAKGERLVYRKGRLG